MGPFGATMPALRAEGEMKQARRHNRLRRRLLTRAARAAILLAGSSIGLIMKGADADIWDTAEPIRLLPPVTGGRLAVEAAMQLRRSVRDFTPGSISLADISQILWAAQGVTDRAGYRTAPSAGALYPLEVWFAAGDVETLGAGTYRYDPREHLLEPGMPGDWRGVIAEAALSQRWIADAAAILIIAAIERRTTVKYGERGIRYIHIEAGHVAQNVYLQATALGLGTTIVGAFDDDAVAHVVDLPGDRVPLCLLPIGRH
jgi:SagB-type dehydrogenase family enzyme